MRVAFDAQLAVGTATGIGEYQRGLASALRSISVDLAELRCTPLDPWRFDRRVFWDQVLLPLQAARSGAQLMHCTSGTMPGLSSLPIVVTVHDVAWLRVQAHTKSYARAYFGKVMVGLYARAARVIVDSAFTRAELLALSGVDAARVDVVYPGVAEDIITLVREPDRASPLLLVVGTVERRKNLLVAIRALALVEDAVLVSVGPPTPYLDECRAEARRLGVAQRVEFRGYVARAELLGLYRRASVALVPSYYEGFGYGAAQALCAGVPVIAAATSSLNEVVAESGRLVPPDDIDAWVTAIRSAINDHDGDDKIRESAARRFSWKTAAHATRAVYAKAG